MIKKFTHLCMFLITSGLLLLTVNSFAQLNGNYTIGGGGANYSSFNAAVSALKNQGVSGPVTFTVNPGTYTERVEIPSISGASSTNKITFNGVNKSTRKITYAGTTNSTRAVVVLTGTRYINFKNITIESTGQYDYALAVFFTKDAQYNTFDSCTLKVPTQTQGYTSICVMATDDERSYYRYGTNARNNTISHCLITGGYFNVTWMGNSSYYTDVTNNQFLYNTFTDAYYYNYYSEYVDKVTLKGNLFENKFISTYGYSIMTYYGSGSVIEDNVINPGSYGIYMYYENYYYSGNTRIVNNMISNFLGTSYHYGITLYYGYNTEIYHNSVWVESPGGSASYSALFMYYMYSGCKVKNNILVNTGGGSAFYKYQGTYNSGDIDYNNYYSSNGTFVYWDGTTYADISSLKSSTSPQNQNCISSAPHFNNRANLHYSSGTVPRYAPYLSSVPKDIDQDPRGTTNTMMGADEHVFPDYDLDLVSIDNPVVPEVGTNSITFSYANTGAKTLNAQTVYFGYSINGGSWVNETYSMTSYPAATNPRTYTFTTPWYIGTEGTYTVSVRIYPQVANDDDTADIITTTMCTGAKGTYTIDASGGGQFKTFNEAIALLKNCGIAGPVVFNVNAGTYSEQVTIPQIKGMSATNTVTFIGKGKDNTVLTYAGTSTAAYMWQTLVMQGADYFTFKDMRIQNTGTNYGVAVFVTQGADYNTWENCMLDVPNTTSSYNLPINFSGSLTSYGSSGNTGNYNKFYNNTITGGYFSAYIYGGGSTSVIKGNEFIGNHISNSYYYGLYFYYSGFMKIERNVLTGMRNTTGGYSIMSYYGTANSIQANIINPIYYGIYCYYENYYYQGNSSVIASNMISNFVYSYQCGMYLYQTYNVSILNNNVWVDGTQGGSYSYSAILTYYMYNQQIKNNILISTGNTLLLSLYTSSTSYTCQCDYNMFVYSGTASRFAIYSNYFSNYTAFKNYTTYIGTHDVNSFDNIDPQIQSKSNMRLNPGSKGFVGAFVPVLTFDVDGDPRCQLISYIGADEPTWTVAKTDFTFEDTMCKGSPITFFNTGLESEPHNTSWFIKNDYKTNNWNFTSTFANKGYDTVTLIQQTCAGIDTVSKAIYIDDPNTTPVVEFSATKNVVEIGQQVDLHDLSVNCPNSWLWEITPATKYNPATLSYEPTYTLINNTTLASPNPQLKFNFDGSYDVCLTVGNTFGTAQKYCKTGYINVLFSDVMCGANVEAKASYGVLYDDGGPTGSHGANKKCFYVIKSCGDDVQINFKEFALAEDAYMRIYDGGSSAGTPIWNKDYGTKGITGNVNDPRFQKTITATQTGMVYIEFESDAATASGFKLEWSSIGKGNYLPPIAQFDAPDTGCIVLPFYYENTSFADKAASTFAWDFDGNGTYDSYSYHGQFNTSFQGLAATYLSKLVVDNCGGSDTFIRKVVLINPQSAPQADFTANINAPVLNQDIVVLTCEGKELACVNKWQWKISPSSFYFTNETNQFSEHPQIIFQDTTCYDVTLVMGNTNTIYTNSLTKTCFIKPKKYCNPVVMNLHTDMGISRVKIAQIDNKTSVGTAGYNNYTNDEPGYLISGQTYDVTVERLTTFNAFNRYVYIDFNNDGDFNDAGELAASEMGAKTKSWTGSVYIPVSANLGATTMRVIADYGSVTPDPCGPYKFGEVEDYRVIISPDDIAPEITILGDNPVYLEIGNTYIDEGADAVDNIMGKINNYVHNGVPLFVANNYVNTSQLGLYNVVYNACDTLWNCNEVRRAVYITPDKTPPVITLKGGDPLTVNVNIPFVDTFYSAYDLADGDITSKVQISGYLDVYTVGTYTRTYTVTDASGYTTSVSRTLSVYDGAAPEITLLGQNPLYLEILTPYVEMGTAYSDNYWPKEKISYSVVGLVDTTKAGTYKISYSVIDYSGNGPNTVTRTIIVWDSTAPVIYALGGDVIQHEVNTKFYDPGLDIQDNSFTGFTTTRWGSFLDQYPDETPTKLGNYIIFYKVKDASGNESEILGRVVKVVDSHAPELELIGAPYIFHKKWDPYVDEGYTVKDNYYKESDLTVTVDNNVNIHEEGIYFVCYTAEDPSENEATQVCRLVKVIYENVSVNENDAANKLQVYPNPTTGKFIVDVNLTKGSDVSISVLNLLGEEITVLNKGILTQSIFEVDMNAYAAGIYVVKVQTADNTYLERLVISR